MIWHVAVSVEKQVRQHDFPENEEGHFCIRLIMEQMVQRMVSSFQVAVVRRLIHTQRQAGHSLGDDPHACVHRGKLNGRVGGDGFARDAAAKVKHRSGADAVAGLVPRTEQCSEGIFHVVYLRILFLEIDVKLLDIDGNL